MTAIKEKSSTTSLDGHDQALKVYLDSLLFEAAPVMEVADLQSLRQQEQDVLPASQTAKQDAEPLPKPVLPEWCGRPFECVLFKAGGFLTLAIPLAKLNGIIDWPGLQSSALPVHPDWFW